MMIDSSNLKISVSWMKHNLALAKISTLGKWVMYNCHPAQQTDYWYWFRHHCYLVSFFFFSLLNWCQTCFCVCGKKILSRIWGWLNVVLKLCINNTKVVIYRLVCERYFYQRLKFWMYVQFFPFFELSFCASYFNTYCEIIIVRGGSMFLDFVGYSYPWICIPTNLLERYMYELYEIFDKTNKLPTK